MRKMNSLYAGRQVPSLLLLALVALLAGCGAHVHHIVQKHETLYSVSFRYNQDYRDVARWNGIEPPYTLRPGQHLRIAPPRAPSHGERMVAAQQQPGTQPSPATQQQTASVQESRPAPSQSPATRTPTPGRDRPAVTVPLSPAPVRPSPPAGQSGPQLTLAWQWPVRDMFSRQDASVKPARKGLDIIAARGEPVAAAAGGRVVYGGMGIPHFGNLVIIKHDERYLSAYAHNERLLVAEGDQVAAGQQIAEMGDTGTGTNAVKLHFEIRLDGEPVDPMQYLPGGPR